MFCVANEVWEAGGRTQIKMLATKEVVNSDGDGECDSPGLSAKLGTYNLMDDYTGNVIVAFNVAQVTQ